VPDEVERPAKQQKKRRRNAKSDPPTPVFPRMQPSAAALIPVLNAEIDRTRLIPDLNTIIAAYADLSRTTRSFPFPALTGAHCPCD
jgi:hypothetical protein